MGQASAQNGKMEEFTSGLDKGQHLISWDLVAGHRHVHFHPNMVDYFCFAFDGERYQCLALPLGWGPSSAVFCRLLLPFVTYIRTEWRYSVLWYLDDFLF